MRKTGDVQVLPNVVGCDYVWTMIMMRRMRRRRRPMNMYTLRHTEYTKKNKVYVQQQGIVQ